MCHSWPFDPLSETKRLNPRIVSRYKVTESPFEVVNVTVTVNVLDTWPLDDQTRRLKVVGEIGFYWNDPRLAMDQECLDFFNISECHGGMSSPDWKIFSFGEFANSLWSPVIMTTNLIEVKEMHKQITDMILIEPCSGNTGIIGAQVVTVSCPMNFWMYPFDTQICLLQFRSISVHESLKATVLTWDRDPRVTNKRYASFGGVEEAQNWERTIYVHKPLNDNCLECKTSLTIEFQYRRLRTSTLVQTMLPSFLLVLASFATLWIAPHLVPGRMTLAITTMLTLMSMINSVFDKAPKTAYLKAIDIWLMGCFMFTFLVLIEFCVIIALEASNDNQEPKARKGTGRSRRQAKSCLSNQGVDRWARIILPLLFFVSIGSYVFVVTRPGEFPVKDGMEKVPLNITDHLI